MSIQRFFNQASFSSLALTISAALGAFALSAICIVGIVHLIQNNHRKQRHIRFTVNGTLKPVIVTCLLFFFLACLQLRIPKNKPECFFECTYSNVTASEACEETTISAFGIERVFECSLLIVLSICIFQSLLACQKVLISVLIGFIFLIFLWFLEQQRLQNREFLVWRGYNVTYGNVTLYDQLAEYCSGRSAVGDLRVFLTIISIFSILLTAIQSHRSELIARFDFIWKLKALAEGREMEIRHEQNRAVLQNILPAHVAEHFLKNESSQRPDFVYHEGRDNVAVMFVTITEFDKFYQELDANNEGVECLRVLNEIIVDFDTQLMREEFKCIEKIKTISTTYMLAAGLTGEVKGNAHVVALVRFALRLFAAIRNINEHSFNNFNLRVGINVGPLVAGVIGVKKPHYDIWGNSVNVASRMDSSGIPGKIQVTEEVKKILEQEGYELERRGVINVKGKGEMVTYFLKVPEVELDFDTN